MSAFRQEVVARGWRLAPLICKKLFWGKKEFYEKWLVHGLLANLKVKQFYILLKKKKKSVQLNMEAGKHAY